MIPVNWVAKRLDEIGEIVSGSTPSTANQTYWDGEIVWVTPADLSKLNTPYLHTSDKRITDKGLASCSARMLPAGSIVISSRAPIGYVAIPTVEFCTNQGCKSIRLRSSYDSEFTYYNLNYHIARLKNLGEGTTFAEISKATIAKVVLPFPIDIDEQAKISEILTTVDRAIEQTEALIAKQRRIKTGLMQDLLTRGIDEHGNIRSEATHAFKDSPLGRIPVEWEITTLKAIVAKSGGFIQTGPFGSQLHAYDYVPSGVPVIMPQDIVDGAISTENIAYITLAKATSLGRHLTKPNDVVFGRRGDLSRCVAISETEQDWLCGTGSMLLRVPTDTLLARWFVHFYRYDYGQRQIAARAVGSTMVNLNSTLLNELVVLLPDIDEQARVADAIELVQTSIQELVANLGKLRSVKTGLMQDLLTGRVRVTSLHQHSPNNGEPLDHGLSG